MTISVPVNHVRHIQIVWMKRDTCKHFFPLKMLRIKCLSIQEGMVATLWICTEISTSVKFSVLLVDHVDSKVFLSSTPHQITSSKVKHPLPHLKTIPSENGSSESTSSSSASPPSVIIWYISFSLLVMTEKPAMNSLSRCWRSSSRYLRCWSRAWVISSNSATRFRYRSSCRGTTQTRYVKDISLL